jgi:pseudouridine kinase
MSKQRHVLVIGSAGIDVKGRPAQDITWEMPNVGQVRNSVGGVARNIAENLAHLEVSTVLLTAVGRDREGKRVKRSCREKGIHASRIRVVEGGRTGTYLALLKPDGELLAAISDFEIMKAVDRGYLLDNEKLFADAAMVIIDATLGNEALQAVFELAGRYQVRVCADPTTPSLAGRLCPYIPQLYLITPNAAETSALCGEPATDHDSALNAARHLVTLGAKIAVVTLGEQGLAYADASGGGYIGALRTQVVDSSGAGDAFSAGAIFGLLNGVPVDEAMRLGATAASLTLQSRETVLPELTQELLYDQLVV